MSLFLRSSILLLLLLEIISSRPAMQRIMVNNHIWEVPNEPGWEEVIRDATAIQKQLHLCTTAAECRQVIDQLHAVFNYYPASRKYLESNPNSAYDIMASIFKWG